MVRIDVDANRPIGALDRRLPLERESGSIYHYGVSERSLK
jgi:hypothetical protein